MSKGNGVIMRKQCKIQSKIWPWLFHPYIIRGVVPVMGEYMCEVSSLYVKLKISYRVEIVKSLKSKFDLLTQNQKRSPSCDCQHMCEVSAMYATRKWSYANGKKFEVNLTLTFHLLTPNSIEVLHGSRSTHVWSTIIVSQNEMELSCRNGKKFEVQIRLWPLTPKSLEVLLGSWSTHVWSIFIISWKEKELLCRNHFSTDGSQTAMVKPVSQLVQY